MIYLFWFEFSTVIWHCKSFLNIFECRSFIDGSFISTYIIKDSTGDDISYSGSSENLSILRYVISDIESSFFG